MNESKSWLGLVITGAVISDLQPGRGGVDHARLMEKRLGKFKSHNTSPWVSILKVTATDNVMDNCKQYIILPTAPSKLTLADPI